MTPVCEACRGSTSEKCPNHAAQFINVPAPKWVTEDPVPCEACGGDGICKAASHSWFGGESTEKPHLCPHCVDGQQPIPEVWWCEEHQAPEDPSEPPWCLRARLAWDAYQDDSLADGCRMVRKLLVDPDNL